MFGVIPSSSNALISLATMLHQCIFAIFLAAADDDCDPGSLGLFTDVETSSSRK